MTTDIDALVERLESVVAGFDYFQQGPLKYPLDRDNRDDISKAAQALTRLSEENARLREGISEAIALLDTGVLGPDDWQGALSTLRRAALQGDA